MMSDKRNVHAPTQSIHNGQKKNRKTKNAWIYLSGCFLLVYMKITPLPIFGIVFVSQTTNHPSMFYITYDSLYFENFQEI